MFFFSFLSFQQNLKDKIAKEKIQPRLKLIENLVNEKGFMVSDKVSWTARQSLLYKLYHSSARAVFWTWEGASTDHVKIGWGKLLE